MLVVTRFQVPEGDAAAFRTWAEDLLALLSALPGFDRGSLGRAPDDQDLWVLATAWEGVGAYRRALSAYDVKMTAPAVMAFAVNEPSAFEVVTSAAPPEQPV
jgi:quinol monooxygenase YgiN